MNRPPRPPCRSRLPIRYLFSPLAVAYRFPNLRYGAVATLNMYPIRWGEGGRRSGEGWFIAAMRGCKAVET